MSLFVICRRKQTKTQAAFHVLFNVDWLRWVCQRGELSVNG
jgi:hypothetical protein